MERKIFDADKGDIYSQEEIRDRWVIMRRSKNNDRHSHKKQKPSVSSAVQFVSNIYIVYRTLYNELNSYGTLNGKTTETTRSKCVN